MSDLAGRCPMEIPACTAIPVTSQTEKMTTFEFNGREFDISGNWTAHTHHALKSCQEENALLAQRGKGGK
jgi:hypothetical protein